MFFENSLVSSMTQWMLALWFLVPVGSVVTLMVNCKGDLPNLMLPGPWSLWWAPANPRLHRRPSNTSREFWFSHLLGHCCFPLGVGASKIFFVPSKIRVSVSLSPVEVMQTNSTGLQGQIPWGFLLLCQIPRLGSLMWSSEASEQWEYFFDILVLHFVGHPPDGNGILFYCDCTPSYHLDVASSLSLDMGYLIWGVLAFSCQWLISS